LKREAAWRCGIDACRQVCVHHAEFQGQRCERQQQDHGSECRDPEFAPQRHPPAAAPDQGQDKGRDQKGECLFGIERENEGEDAAIQRQRAAALDISDQEEHRPGRQTHRRHFEHHLPAPKGNSRQAEKHYRGADRGDGGETHARQIVDGQRQQAGKDGNGRLRSEMRNTKQRKHECLGRREQRRIEADRDRGILQVIFDRPAHRIAEWRGGDKIVNKGAVHGVARRVEPPKIPLRRRGKKKSRSGSDDDDRRSEFRRERGCA